ncbi:MAG: GTPase ObgE [Alphaproteobacteria bacterium]|nr:GTPase ObgE [Alphaproteobacteria bacterium]
MKFLDEAKIYLESGKGGAGCVSFRREKYIDMGGPNGGNGGRGGHIIFECVENLNTLIDFRYTQHFRAKIGHHGQGSNKFGKDGKDLIVKVPLGTVILDEDKETVLADMMVPGERMIFLKGGDGGFGNAHFKSATNRAPRKCLPGWPGDERAVWLRLKLIADSGIIGLPNSGKSTFLSAVSRAKPKIADYPFTTLIPNLGVINFYDNEFVMADIPGLIEGAHEGHGLGMRFLGHVERTSVLLHLIDMTQDDIVGAYKTVREELEAYGGNLAEKPEVIALNKMDALGQELAEDQRNILSKFIRKKVHILSAVSGEGVENILSEIWRHIEKRHI